MRFILPLLTLALAACASPGRRVAANPELFASFPPEVQDAVREGRVEPGFTPDMVEMALGAPHRTYRRATSDGETVIWQYVRIRHDVSTRPFLSGGSRRYSYSTYIDQVDTREIPEIRVEFLDGTVRAVETLEP